MAKRASELRTALGRAGFSQSAIEAAWPEWWSDKADASASAQNDLRFSLARKLGLDPRSLLEDEEPKFVWTDHTKFKGLAAETAFEQAALSSFGYGLAQAVLSALPVKPLPDALGASQIRRAILASETYVRLPDVVATCWALGIPVVYLRVFPLNAKRMAAMAVNVAGRYAILISQDAKYPAPVAYYVAHELGHIILGHLHGHEAIVDIGDPLSTRSDDGEEIAADRFALELLTGAPEPRVVTNARSFIARQLADTVQSVANEARIEPGTLALCFGHSTGRWDKAYGALKHIYGEGRPIWRAVNQLADQTIEWEEMPEDMGNYVRQILGINGDV